MGTAALVLLVVFDFATPEQVAEWHGDAAVALKPGGGMEVRFDKAGGAAWTCWSVPDNWEKFEKLVIELDAAEAGTELGLAVSDDEEYSFPFALTLGKGENQLAIPVRMLFEGGLQTKYIRGIELWSRKGPATVTLKRIGLSGKGESLAGVVRRGERVLHNAEGPDADLFWIYSHEAGRVDAVAEHPSEGKRSFRMKFPDQKPVSTYGRFPHDWRGYETLVFSVYNPKDTPVTLKVSLKDTWIAFFSSAYLASREFTLGPKQETIVEFPLANLEGMSGGKGPARLNMEYMQQMLLEVPQKEDRPVELFVDNIRLVGSPAAAAPAGEIAGAQIPKFGFDKIASTLKLPADLHALRINVPADAFGKLKVGAGRAVITPKVGTQIASGGSKLEGVLDDIFVRVVLIQQAGRDTVAWMHIDNLYMPAQQEMPPILKEKLGIKPENFFWSATHNHNSGAPWASKEFTAQIIDGFTRAAEDAAKSMRPAAALLGTTDARCNFNRAMKGPDGKFYGNLDHKYMNFLMDSRPTDTELGMLWFVDEKGRPIAGAVAYDGHANMMCRIMPWCTGDWSGWMERLLEGASGAVVMHINGAEGDVDMRGIQVSYDRTIRAGWDVATAAARATRKLEFIDPSALAGVGVRHGEAIGTPVKEGAPEQKLGVNVLTLGTVAFVDVGGEMWSQIGLELRKGSPYPHTYIDFKSGYYYPEEWAFEAKLYGTKDRRPDWGPAIRDKAIRMLKEVMGK